MAIYWESPDKTDLRLPPKVKTYYKAELDELGRMRLWSRRANIGRWGYRTAWPDDALEALVAEIEHGKANFSQELRRSF